VKETDLVVVGGCTNFNFQKQQDLLARYERKNKENVIKRGLNAETIWASEGDKVITTTKPSENDASVMTQLDPLK
jgi:hypothetical protein